ncbi:MAG: hypothetical protein ACPHK8_04045 [Thermoplasmatota archaeon]
MKAWAIVLCLAIAGCADSTPEVVEDPEPTITSDPQNATVNPVAWQQGDWFGHHIFFGAADTEGYHIDVVLAGEMGDQYHFVTDDPEIARFEAVLDVPITGAISKADLDTTGFGGAWELYDFPLTDGKTWTGTIQYDLFESYDLTFTATYSDDVSTFKEGRPGFDIVGVSSNGTVLLETDYDPSFGWYNEFKLYTETGPGDDFIFRSLHMGWGHNWTGTAYEYDADLIIDDEGIMVAPNGQVQNMAQPMVMNVSQESTHLMMLQYCFAYAGANDGRLRAPSGTEYDCQSTSLPDGPDPNAWPGVGDGDFREIPHETGNWLYNRISAGFVAGGGLELWELTEQPIEF